MNYLIDPKCRHTQKPLKVGEMTLWLSSAVARSSTDWKVPALGVYLAPSSWKSRITYVGMPLPAKTQYPHILVDWPDMGMVDGFTLGGILDTIDEYAEAGPIEIACVGGHGRTGTLAAILCILYGGMRAQESIDYVWENYCMEAIESRSQTVGVYNVAGEEPPPLPVETTVFPTGRMVNGKWVSNSTTEVKDDKKGKTFLSGDYADFMQMIDDAYQV